MADKPNTDWLRFAHKNHILYIFAACWLCRTFAFVCIGGAATYVVVVAVNDAWTHIYGLFIDSIDCTLYPVNAMTWLMVWVNPHKQERTKQNQNREWNTGDERNFGTFWFLQFPVEFSALLGSVCSDEWWHGPMVHVKNTRILDWKCSSGWFRHERRQMGICLASLLCI